WRRNHQQRPRLTANTTPSRGILTCMDEALRSATWIVLSGIIAAYLTSYAASRYLVGTSATSTPIVIRDVTQAPGAHHLYGVIIVPNACDEIEYATASTGDNAYQFAFRTWMEPYVRCLQSPVQRVFDTIVFSTSTSVQYSATMDDVPVPIVVYPVVSE